MKSSMMVCCVLAVVPYVVCATEYFADANNGNNSWDGTVAVHEEGTLHGPKKTAQAAVDLATDGNGTIITLLPGVYNVGGKTNTAKDSANTMSNRIVVTQNNVTIRSSTGKPSDVHVVGEKDFSVNAYGIGPNAMRCLAHNRGTTGVVLHGITFRDGAATSTTRGGGIYAQSNGSVTIIDCVVSNCAAPRGGGVNCVTAHSSLLSGNYATSSSTGSAASQGTFANCLIVYNSDAAGAPMENVTAVVNCTIANNGGSSASLMGNAPAAGSKMCNVIAFGHRNGDGASANVDLYSCVFANCTSCRSADSASVTNAVAAPQVASPFLDDWRPLSTGSCVGRGKGEYLTLVPLPEGYTYHDMAGNAIDTSSTSIMVGAYQETVTPAAARVRFGASFVVEGSSRTATPNDWITPLKWPTQYNVKACISQPYAIFRDEDSIVSDNTTYRLLRHARYDGWTPIVPERNVSATCTLGCIVCSNVFYADPAGDDMYDGTAPTWAGGVSLVGPKKTLQAAVNLASDDYTIIYAAPGVYDAGGVRYSSVSNRVCDNGRNVGIIATGGPGSATIKGMPDPGTGGLGDNAMRCVFFSGTYSFIQGFEITGGYTLDNDGNAYAGGGFYGSSSYPQVIDCTVSSNYASKAGGGFNCTAIRCRFIGNNGKTRAAVTRASRMYRCLIDGNTGPKQIEAHGIVDQCTIGADTRKNKSSDAIDMLYNAVGPVLNSIVLTPAVNSDVGNFAATNCAFVTGCGISASQMSACVVTNVEILALDGNYCPVIGANAAIDMADLSLSDIGLCGGLDFDFSGSQRIMNGSMDIGAFEANWSGKYASDIYRKCTVSEVSPEVYETERGTVFLPSGSLSGILLRSHAKYRATVNVTGSGTLKLVVNGIEVGSFSQDASAQSCAFASVAGTSFTFSYLPGDADIGGAEIVSIVAEDGFCITIK